jgi:hypothetical protein
MPSLGSHPIDVGHLATRGSLIGGEHELGGLAGGQELGNNLLNEGHGLDSFATGGHGLDSFAGEPSSPTGGGHELVSGFAGEGRELNSFARGGDYMGDGLVLDSRAIRGEHLMYGRMPKYGRGGVFLGYYFPNPSICYQYPDDYNPAVGCYGLYPDS